MDRFGNAKEGIPIPATWLGVSGWIAMADEAGARIVSLRWPLPMHDYPWRLIARPELQFVATLLPLR